MKRYLAFAAFVLCAALQLMTFASCMSSPAFVGTALPFIVKIDKNKLKHRPDDDSLRLKAGSYNIMYANAFIERPARMLPPAKFEKRERELARAKRYYLSGAKILRDRLEKKYPGLNPAQVKKEDVAAVYWLAAGELCAYSIDPFDIDLGLHIPQLAALIGRAYQLDPDFGVSTLDEFYISFYAGLPPALGGDVAKAKTHFKRAVEKTGGKTPGPYLSYVDGIAITEQDREKFDEYLNKIINIDVSKIDGDTDRLAAKLAQKKAKYYLDNADRFIPVFE